MSTLETYSDNGFGYSEDDLVYLNHELDRLIDQYFDDGDYDDTARVIVGQLSQADRDRLFTDLVRKAVNVRVYQRNCWVKQ